MEKNTDTRLNEWRKRAATRSPKAKEFIEGILSDLEDHDWLKDAIVECLILENPGEAHDAALLLCACMKIQVEEIEGRESERDTTIDG